MDAISIIEELLNSRIVTIRDRVQEGEKVRYVINRKETMLARDKAEQIKEAFRDWIFKEPKRRKNMWIFIMKPLTATDNEAMMALI